MLEIAVTNLNINRAEALRYLRLPQGLDEHMLPADIIQQLDEAEQAVLQAAEPRFVWREFALEHTPGGISLGNTALVLPGSDIARLLNQSSTCLLLAATLGLACDELIRRTEPVDMSRALMLDAFASAAVENLCDQVQAQLANYYAAKQLYITDRFSPGYGNLPIGLQKPLCAALNAQRRIGLTVSNSGILLPRKSVTAVMGLSPTPTDHRQHNCSTCNMQAACPYKKAGKLCD